MFLAGESIVLEKKLLEEAATFERFEYSPLGSESKNSNLSNLLFKTWLFITLGKI